MSTSLKQLNIVLRLLPGRKFVDYLLANDGELTTGSTVLDFCLCCDGYCIIVTHCIQLILNFCHCCKN